MITIIAKGLRAKLTGDATISASVGARVYLENAGEDSALPYIVMSLVSGGSTNDTPRDALDEMWQIKAVADAGATALTLESAIRAALHDAAITYDAPWYHLDCQHESPFYFVEHADRRQYYHAGGTYRIRATENY